jgi:D-glycero-alpha-D-manno-heptose 1-phosphate guanylyltransferase
MQAIILAGGFGTRLRSVLADVPKPMAPLHGKPFLAYLLDYLQSQGVRHVVLSVHYLREQIEAYFKHAYGDITIQYAVEDKPLGTGGAIINSLPLIDPSRPFFVLNGDTFLKMDYRTMLVLHHQQGGMISMALRRLSDCSRYGVVMTEQDQVTSFIEQGGGYPGLINAGVYLFNANLLRSRQFPEKFSFERDFLFPEVAIIKPQAYVVDDYFIDIGVPEDYERAMKDFTVSATESYLE